MVLAKRKYRKVQRTKKKDVEDMSVNEILQWNNKDSYLEPEKLCQECQLCHKKATRMLILIKTDKNETPKKLNLCSSCAYWAWNEVNL